MLFNVLITALGTATSVNLVKLLKPTRKYRIIGVDINDFGYTAGSMLVDRFIKIDRYDSPDYVGQISNILTQEDIHLFIPIHDYEIGVLLENAAKFKGKSRILLPDEDVYHLFSNKYEASKALTQIGVDSPPIIEDNNSILSHDRRYIARKKRSVGSKGIEICTIEELLPYIQDKEYFVQEFIQGPEFTVDLICGLDNNPYLIIPRERLEIKAGVSTKARITKDDMMIELVTAIARKFPLAGFSNIQFIKKQDRIYFIELNPRFGGMSIASALASFNYVDEFISAILNETDLNGEFVENMKRVKWGSIITRYYEEILFLENA